LAGIERGGWWPTGKLIDRDLDPVRDEPGWEEVHAYCLEKTQRLVDQWPAPMVRDGTGDGTVVTIQGAHALEDDLFNTWTQATPGRWIVITPVIISVIIPFIETTPAGHIASGHRPVPTT
jgi:hypothetical protein